MLTLHWKMKRSLCQNGSIIGLPIKTENLEIEGKYRSHERRHEHQYRGVRKEALKCLNVIHVIRENNFKAIQRKIMRSKIKIFKI